MPITNLSEQKPLNSLLDIANKPCTHDLQVLEKVMGWIRLVIKGTV